jgi:ABC-2 type transport system ATP-binding protein
MKRRLMVAKAMAHNPPILVLDEPTAGVDVAQRRGLWQTVRQLNQAGTTVLLTTHYLEEAEELCSRIAILNGGRIIVDDTKKNLLSQLDRKKIVVKIGAPLEVLPSVLAESGWILSKPDRLSLAYRPSETRVGPVLLKLQAYGLSICDVVTEEADLESLFLETVQGQEAGKAGQAPDAVSQDRVNEP